MEKSAVEELGKVALLLRMERDEEERRLESVISNRSIKEKKEDGLCWYPIEFKEFGFGNGGQIWIVFNRVHGEHPADNFQSGSPVFLYKTEDAGEKLKALIAWIKADSVKLIFSTDELPDGIRDGRWAMDVRFDDRSFFEMEKAMSEVINVEKGRLKEIRDVLLAYKSTTLLREPQHGLDDFNDSQKNAIETIIGSEDAVIVHGPPGTGKTTTLVEAIRRMAQKEKILVCAPSNAAVDHLTLKLQMAGVNVLRLGHPSRLSEEVLTSGLDHKLNLMPEQKLIKELRKRADDSRKEADKYKRNFGPEERKQRSEARAEARSLDKEAREISNFAEQSLIAKADVIACTLIGASDRRLKEVEFNTVFIDEAAQSLEPATWIPILKANKVVLAGDPWQLPPTVKSSQAAKAGLEVTLIEKAIKRGENAILLNEQYRMNNEIMAFSNRYFYGDKLIANADNAMRKLGDGEMAIEFIDTAGCGFEENRSTSGESRSNIEEASLLCRHLAALMNQYPDLTDIGVISPYRAQVDLLDEMLPKDARIAVQTVDGFQGQEREVIYISLVRNNENGQLGFLTDYRRMNVAMTRAKKKLVVIGDSATLGNDAFYASFLEYCEEIEAYKSAWEYMG